jgi:hypothetical protein
MRFQRTRRPLIYSQFHEITEKWHTDLNCDQATVVEDCGFPAPFEDVPHPASTPRKHQVPDARDQCGSDLNFGTRPRIDNFPPLVLRYPAGFPIINAKHANRPRGRHLIRGKRNKHRTCGRAAAHAT